jgi:hypothetical protein
MKLFKVPMLAGGAFKNQGEIDTNRISPGGRGGEAPGIAPAPMCKGLHLVEVVTLPTKSRREKDHFRGSR